MLSSFGPHICLKVFIFLINFVLNISNNHHLWYFFMPRIRWRTPFSWAFEFCDLLILFVRAISYEMIIGSYNGLVESQQVQELGTLKPIFVLKIRHVDQTCIWFANQHIEVHMMFAIMHNSYICETINDVCYQ